MIVHAFQPRTIDIQEKIKYVKKLCTMSMETCSHVVSQILGKFRQEMAAYTNLHK